MDTTTLIILAGGGVAAYLLLKSGAAARGAPGQLAPNQAAPTDVAAGNGDRKTAQLVGYIAGTGACIAVSGGGAAPACQFAGAAGAWVGGQAYDHAPAAKAAVGGLISGASCIFGGCGGTFEFDESKTGWGRLGLPAHA